MFFDRWWNFKHHDTTIGMIDRVNVKERHLVVCLVSNFTLEAVPFGGIFTKLAATDGVIISDSENQPSTWLIFQVRLIR